MKILQRLARAARPSPPPPPPKPKPKPAPKPAVVDEMSTGQGSALRREANARLGGGYTTPAEATPTTTPVEAAPKARADAPVEVTDEQIEAVAANVESSDDVLLLADGTVPGEAGELEAHGLPEEWTREELPDDVRDALIAGVYERRPDLFIASTFSEDESERVATALSSSLDSGALSEEDAIVAADSLGERGPLLLMDTLAQGGTTDAQQHLADELFESDESPHQAAAALYYTSSPEAFERNLSDSGDQTKALRAISEVLGSGALDDIYGRDSARGDRVYGSLVDSAMTVFTQAKPAALGRLLDDQNLERDFDALEGFFNHVLFDPRAVGALEDRGWSRDEIREGVEGTLADFTSSMLERGGIGGDVSFPNGPGDAGERLGRLFGLLETASDLAVERESEGSASAAFGKDVAFGASAAVLAAVITNPALAAGAGILLGASAAQVPAGEALDYDTARAALDDALDGATSPDAGFEGKEQLDDLLARMRYESQDPAFSDTLSQLVSGLAQGSDDVTDYRR
jgi:hypothetical protein